MAADRGPPMLLGMHADDEKVAFTARDAQLAPGTASRHVSVGIAHVADDTAEAVTTVWAAPPRWLGPGLAGYRRADDGLGAEVFPRLRLRLRLRRRPNERRRAGDQLVGSAAGRPGRASDVLITQAVRAGD